MSFGWIDFSSTERNKVISTLKKLEISGTVDELGIGVIRDAFSNLLFPCVSVLQTRAKYFVLIPQLLKEAENNNRLNTADKIMDYIRQKEDEFAEQFRDTRDFGVIGKYGEVKYKPTQLYWNGLKSLEIIPFQKFTFHKVSQIIASRKIADLELNNYQSQEEFDDEMAKYKAHEAVYIPMTFDIDKTSIDLTKQEAEFLYEKSLRSSQNKNSLFTFLITYLKDKNLKFDTFHDIPEEILPEEIRIVYQKAKDFSNFLHGAHIRFNYLYAITKNSLIEADKQKKLFAEWHNNFDWSYNFNKNIAGIKISNRNQVFEFLSNFYLNAKEEKYEELDNLIIKRERAIKGDRSKLRKVKIDENNQPLNFNLIHENKLDYRFSRAKVIINDIVDGLRRGEDA